MHTNSNVTRRKVKLFLVNIALLVVCFWAMAPIVTTVIISLKGQADNQRNPPVLFPCDTPQKTFDLGACRWALEGYERVVAVKPNDDALFGFEITGRMFRIYIPNTILYALTTSLLVAFFASLSGFAFSRYRFRGHNAVMAAIMAVTGVPLLTNLLALYQMEVTLRKLLPIYDDRVFLIFTYLGLFLPISVWIMKGFFDAIPRELEESALIEGCTPVGGLLSVVLPLAMPGLTSVFLLTFVSVWNEFIVAYLLVTSNENKPVMFGLYDFLSQNIINLQVIAAACILIALPVVVLFLFTRHIFFNAMVEGAVKG